MAGERCDGGKEEEEAWDTLWRHARVRLAVPTLKSV